jgi:hypothetical protein
MVHQLKTFLLLSLSVAFGALFPHTAAAQSGIEVIPQEPEYIFGDQITFRGFFSSSGEAIEEVVLLIQVEGESDVRAYPVQIDPAGIGAAVIDLNETPLNAFTTIEYWYQVISAAGETFTSPANSFIYADNRYDWQTLEGPPFKIHWYAGDLAFGQQVLNVAFAGLLHSQELLDVFFPEDLEIYVYADFQALQAALPDVEQDWIAGHADPAQGVILVSLPASPQQQLEMERQIPHEIMHIALNYTDANAYSNLPAWFNEGLASMVELYTNPEYEAIIETAFETGDLLPISSLCQGFPSDSQQAVLAYAESASFTQYLHAQVGNPGFNRLMAAYASGMSCEQGIQQALGTDLTSLEGNWRRDEFSDQLWSRTVQDFLPWLVLLAAILVGPLILAVIFIRRRPGRMEV